MAGGSPVKQRGQPMRGAEHMPESRPTVVKWMVACTAVGPNIGGCRWRCFTSAQLGAVLAANLGRGKSRLDFAADNGATQQAAKLLCHWQVLGPLMNGGWKDDKGCGRTCVATCVGGPRCPTVAPGQARPGQVSMLTRCCCLQCHPAPAAAPSTRRLSGATGGRQPRR